MTLATGAFNFCYEGLFTRIARGFDSQLEANSQAPNYVRNFYGLGNDTKSDPAKDPRYYRERFQNFTAFALPQRDVGTHVRVFGGPVYQRVAVEKQETRVLAHLPDERLHPATLFTTEQYAGAGWASMRRAPTPNPLSRSALPSKRT